MIPAGPARSAGRIMRRAFALIVLGPFLVLAGPLPAALLGPGPQVVDAAGPGLTMTGAATYEVRPAARLV
ncbi:MAG: hypothetical protein ACRDGQ_08765, partial [Candidatus Limnocylindrales bacterium]